MPFKDCYCVVKQSLNECSCLVCLTFPPASTEPIYHRTRELCKYLNLLIPNYQDWNLDDRPDEGRIAVLYLLLSLNGIGHGDVDLLNQFCGRFLYVDRLYIF